MPRLDWSRDGDTWPNNEFSRFLRAGDTDWHVQVVGEGPDLLLLHGTGASTHSWAGLMPLLSKHFRVIVPDLPGHGFSRPASALGLSIPGMARSLSALLEALDARPRIVAGHSAGAPILVQMSLDGLLAPERIVSINGAFMPFKGLAAHLFPPIAKALIWNPFIPQAVAWTASDLNAVRRLIGGTGSTINDESLGLYHRLFQCPSHVRSTINMMARWDLAPVVQKLPKLSVPVVVVSGGRDATVPPSDQDAIARELPKAEVISFPDLGHLAHEEDPGSIANLFLKQTA